jgi:GntR family transcriptional regulator
MQYIHFMATTFSAFGPISAAAHIALYEQVVIAVKREVATGRLRPGDALPSLRTLAADLMVSLITVKRAYEELERDGVIYLRQGLGAFVAAGGLDKVREENAKTLNSALRDAVNSGRAAGLSDSELHSRLQQIIDQGDQG